jgi:hypothetical protein
MSLGPLCTTPKPSRRLSRTAIHEQAVLQTGSYDAKAQPNQQQAPKYFVGCLCAHCITHSGLWCLWIRYLQPTLFCAPHYISLRARMFCAPHYIWLGGSPYHAPWAATGAAYPKTLIVGTSTNLNPTNNTADTTAAANTMMHAGVKAADVCCRDASDAASCRRK